MSKTQKKQKGRLSIILIIVIVVTLIPIIPEKNVKAAILNNPIRNVNGTVTWDCVWFGTYPQAEVVPTGKYTSIDILHDGDVIVSDDIYTALQRATGWDNNGDITLDGNMYRRMKKTDATYSASNTVHYRWQDTTSYHYFKYEPIKWRILSIDGNDAFLLANKGIDCQRYNIQSTDVTWETCTIRSWLNGYGKSMNIYGANYSDKNFINTAFSLEEKNAIFMSNIENADSLSWKTEGGNNTKDKIFLLSESEVYTENAVSYGFSNYDNQDESRRIKSSTYAKAMGSWYQSVILPGYDGGECEWWLRTPGNFPSCAMTVSSSGLLNDHNVAFGYVTVCPAIHLNLSKTNLYSYAGTVSSDGTKNEQGSTGSSEENSYLESMETFTQQHIDFINSNEYNERIKTCWGSVISQGLDTTTGKMGEMLYDALNTGSELIQGKCKSLSIFDNTYDAVITELILAQTDLKESGFELKFENKMLSNISTLESLCQKANPDWSLKEAEYKTNLEKLIESSDDIKKSNPVFYNMCEEIFGDLVSDTNSDLNRLLNVYGKANALQNALNTYTNVVNWVADCLKYNTVVEAYLSTSDEFKQSLKDAVVYMALNASGDNFISRTQYGIMYEEAYEKFAAFQTEDRITTLLLEEYVSNGLDRIEDVFGGAIQKNAMVYVGTGLGIPLKSVSWLYACMEAYKTGWKISEAITDNGTNIDCRELARAYYYLEDAFMWEVEDDAYNLKTEQTYEKAVKFDASYTILKDLECSVLNNYITYLNAQQSSFWNGLLHGFSDYNEWEISIAKIYKLEWQNIKCHNRDENYKQYKTYSTLNVCCPTDVFVYDASGQVVYGIENNQVTTRSQYIDSTIVGNMKLLLIPDISEYTVKVIATDDGAMTYQVNTYDADTGKLNETANYLNVNLNKGDIFTGSYHEEAELENDGTKIEPDNRITDTNDKVLITSVSVDDDTQTLAIGDTTTLKAIISPLDATFPLLSWSSSDENIAVVDEDGLVTAKSQGKCTIQCTAMDGSGIYGTVEIEVIAAETTNHENETTSKQDENKNDATIKPYENETTSKTDENKDDATTKPYENTTKEVLETTSKANVAKKPTRTKITSIKKAKKSIKVLWKKVKGVSGYQLQYSTSKKFKKAKKITIRRAENTNKLVKKIQNKKKYYIRIRTYLIFDGRKYYSDWSKSRSQRIK